MKLFAQRLIDIHSQSSTIDLKDKNFQLSLIDDFLKDKNLLVNYKNEYKTYQNLLKEIQELEEKEKNFIKDKDYYEFLYLELEKASLKEGEQEELEEKVELMSNSEEIKEAISESIFMLDNEEEDNILAKLNNVKNNIKKISSFNEELNNFSSRLESCSIELKDILNGLSSFNEKVNFNKEELEKDNERLDLIYSLEKKHSVNSIEELLKIEQELSEKLKLNNDISSILEKNN
jgi:DNA repair protein RecN (Recombination protein N)